MRLPNSILTFAQGDEDRVNAYTRFSEYYNFFKSGKSVNESGATLSSVNETYLQFYKDEVERMSGRKNDGTVDLMTYCNFTDVKESAFAIMNILSDLVIPNSLSESFGEIAQVVNGAWGDSLKIDMQPRDLFIVAKGGRARRTFDIQRQYKGEKTLLPEVRAITVGVSLYDVLRGKVSLAEFVGKAVLAIETQMKYDIYDTFAATMNALSNTAGDGQLRISGFTQDTAIALAQKVQAWNGGKPAIFLGTKLALSKILPASTNTRILLNDEYVKTGYLRDFFGVPAIELEQIADISKEFAVKIDDKKIYVLSPSAEKVVKVFIEGSTQSQTDGSYANANLQQTATLYKSYGVGAFTSALVGEIELA